MIEAGKSPAEKLKSNTRRLPCLASEEAVSSQRIITWHTNAQEQKAKQK